MQAAERLTEQFHGILKLGTQEKHTIQTRRNNLRKFGEPYRFQNDRGQKYVFFDCQFDHVRETFGKRVFSKTQTWFQLDGTVLLMRLIPYYKRDPVFSWNMI